jgi:hypothetical protein
VQEIDMSFTAEIYLDQVLVDVTFEVEGSPEVPATRIDPASGGIESFYDIVVDGVTIDPYCESEFDTDEQGPTVEGLKLVYAKLTDEQYDKMEKAVLAYDPY